MHFMLFLDRRSHTSKSLSILTTTTTTTAVNIIIITIILFFASTRARVIGTPLSLNEAEELQVIEDIKRRILDHMGLNSPPSLSDELSKNTTRLREKYRNEIKEFLQRTQQNDNYDSFENDSLSNASSNILTLQLNSSVHAMRVPIIAEDKLSASATTTFRFAVPPSLKPETLHTVLQLKSAVLRLGSDQQKYRMRHHRSSEKSKVNISVSLLHHTVNSKKTNRTSSTFLKSFIVHPHKTSNILINLDSIKDHLSYLFSPLSSTNDIVFEMLVTEIPKPDREFLIKNNHRDSAHGGRKIFRNNKRNGQFSHRPKHRARPYISISPELKLKVVEKDTRKSRSRRSTGSDCNSGSLCCRHSIYINFSDIGWDTWVLSPEGYHAYYCQGGCPKRYKSAATFSGIKCLLHEKHPDAVPAPTCAASGYSSLDILHLGENDGLIETSYPDMIVTGCKCY